MISSLLRVFCFRISIMSLSPGSSYPTAAGALRSWKWMGAASKESSLTRPVTKVKLSNEMTACSIATDIAAQIGAQPL